MFTACDRRAFSLVTNFFQKILEAFLPLWARFYNCTAFDLELCNALFKFTDPVKPYCELYDLFFHEEIVSQPRPLQRSTSLGRLCSSRSARKPILVCVASGHMCSPASVDDLLSIVSALLSSLYVLKSRVKVRPVMCLCSVMPLCSQVLCLCFPVMHVAALCCNLSLFFFYVAICSIVISYLHV